MSAVKALALSALVLGATSGAAGGGYSSWTSNTTTNGVFQTSVVTAAPPVTTTTLFGPSTSPSPAPTPGPAATAPAAAPTSFATVASPAAPAYDAFINMGNGPYPDSGSLTSGGALPWYDSAKVDALFGGVPTSAQQAAFTQAIINRVELTFGLAGVPISLTSNPTAPAAHTLSVVSNTTSSWGPVLGLTNVGGSGFDFVDQAASYAKSVDQLGWIVAHNVSHELMLAFGVPESYDQSGNAIDARAASLAMMLSPQSTFSQAAAQALLAVDFRNNTDGSASPGAQLLTASPVPEPSTLAAWGFFLGAVAYARSRRRRASA